MSAPAMRLVCETSDTPHYQTMLNLSKFIAQHSELNSRYVFTPQANPSEIGHTSGLTCANHTYSGMPTIRLNGNVIPRLAVR